MSHWILGRAHTDIHYQMNFSPPNCRSYGDIATLIAARIALSLSLSLSPFLSFVSPSLREYNDLKLDSLSGNMIGFLTVRNDVS